MSSIAKAIGPLVSNAFILGFLIIVIFEHIIIDSVIIDIVIIDIVIIAIVNIFIVR